MLKERWTSDRASYSQAVGSKKQKNKITTPELISSLPSSWAQDGRFPYRQCRYQTWMCHILLPCLVTKVPMNETTLVNISPRSLTSSATEISKSTALERWSIQFMKSLLSIRRVQNLFPVSIESMLFLEERHVAIVYILLKTICWVERRKKKEKEKKKIDVNASLKRFHVQSTVHSLSSE